MQTKQWLMGVLLDSTSEDGQRTVGTGQVFRLKPNGAGQEQAVLAALCVCPGYIAGGVPQS